MISSSAAHTPVSRIAIVAPPWIPLPPPGYGGIEQVVTLQAQVLGERGYEITLIAAPGTEVEAVDCVAPLDDLPDMIGQTEPDWMHALGAQDSLAGTDVVIDHSSPLSALILARSGLPVLHVVHGPVDDAAHRIYASLAERAPGVRLVAISHAQMRPAPELPWAGVCYNALDPATVPFGEEPDGYFAFLGRMAPEKGAAEAIRIARECGRRLLIAAKCREPAEKEYFEAYVEPHLDADVVWLGEIGPDEKFALLGGAAALVFPIDWPEPFGMVMIEAMACGTPVLATPCGSVPEVVVDGVTGFVRPTVEELIAAAREVDRLDRRACRRHVVDRFAPDSMGAQWDALLAGDPAHPPPAVRDGARL